MNDVKPRRVVEVEKKMSTDQRVPDWWRVCSDEEFKARGLAMTEEAQHELAGNMKGAIADITLQLTNPSATIGWAQGARLAQRRIAERKAVLGGLMAGRGIARREARLELMEKRQGLIQKAEELLNAGQQLEALRYVIEAVKTWDVRHLDALEKKP